MPCAEIFTTIAFCGFLFFFGIGSFGLLGPDEPRYAQIAREMLARHDWVVPLLNGTPWLEKPVLYYWSAMLSYSVFGVSDWAARVPSALLATFMVLGIYAFARRFRSGSQLDAALITASSTAAIGFAHGASTDMALAATLTLALLAWYAWLESSHRKWLLASYFCLALGTLAKGPVAPALAGVMLAVFAGLRRNAEMLRRTLWWPGVLLFCAVSFPWYVLVQLRTGTFFRVFILEHNLARFGSNMFQHSQPFWYYLPVLLVSLLPWTVLAFKAVADAISEACAKEACAKEDAGDLEDAAYRLFLLVWAAVPLIVFSISRSKLPGYILPSIPAVTLLVADSLREQARSGKRLPAAFNLLLAMFAASVLAAALLAPAMILHQKPGRLNLMVAGAAWAVTVAGMAATVYTRGAKAVRFVTLVPVIVAVGFVIRVGAPAINAAESARPVARELARMETQPRTVALFNVRRELEYGLNFYRNQAPPIYDRGAIPTEDHLLVAKTGSLDALQALLPGRRFSRVGEFAPQRLEIFWVSTPPPEEHHHH